MECCGQNLKIYACKLLVFSGGSEFITEECGIRDFKVQGVDRRFGRTEKAREEFSVGAVSLKCSNQERPQSTATNTNAPIRSAMCSGACPAASAVLCSIAVYTPGPKYT